MAAPAECWAHLYLRDRSPPQSPTPEVLQKQMTHAPDVFPVDLWDAAAWTAVALLSFVLVQLIDRRWRIQIEIPRPRESRGSPALRRFDLTVSTSDRRSVSVDRRSPIVVRTSRVIASSAPALASCRALRRHSHSMPSSIHRHATPTPEFLADAARLDQGIVTLGRILGSGGVADVFALTLVRQDHRRVVQARTGGRGLAVKMLQQVRCPLPHTVFSKHFF